MFQSIQSRIAGIRLFSSLGAVLNDESIMRIRTWTEWPGPEDPLVKTICIQQQALHDRIIVPEHEAEWLASLRFVVGVASTVVPYKDGGDAWYAPNMAAWFAAWTFALEAAILEQGQSPTASLRAQIYWYERGHWPCALMAPDESDDIGDYVIF